MTSKTISTQRVRALFLSCLAACLLAVVVYQFWQYQLGVKLLVQASGEDVTLPSPGAASSLAYELLFQRHGVINNELAGQGKGRSASITIFHSLTGKLNLRLFDQVDEGDLYLGKFSELNNELSNGETQSNQRTTLSYSAFAFTLNHNGTLTLYENGLHYPAEFKGMLSQILPYIQVVGRSAENSDVQPSWVSEESDVLGNYTAQYSAVRQNDVISINKKKLTYSQLQPAPESKNTLHAFVLQHQSKISIKQSEKWAETIRLSETIRLQANGKLISEMPTSFTAQRIKADNSFMLPQSISELRNIINKRKYYAVDEKQSLLAADSNAEVVLTDALENYLPMSASTPSKARRQLISYLRQHPELAVEFVDWLHDSRSQLSDAEEVKLWALLAKVGHKESQDAYVYALTNPNFDQIIQYRAIAHLRFFEAPDRKFIEQLWQIEAQLSQASISQATTGRDNDNKILAQASLFAIATLSKSKSIDADDREAIITTLQRRLQSSNDMQSTSTLVTAAGNTYNPAMLESIVPYLAADDDQLKAKAFVALSRMPGSDALEHFEAAYEKIGSENQQLQYSALQQLSNMHVTETSMLWARARVKQANNPTEVVSLIRILGDNVEAFPDNEKFLKHVLLANPSVKIKSEIYRYISPS